MVACFFSEGFFITNPIFTQTTYCNLPSLKLFLNPYVPMQQDHFFSSFNYLPMIMSITMVALAKITPMDVICTLVINTFSLFPSLTSLAQLNIHI